MAGADTLALFGWLLAGYLAGSIPFGLLLTRWAGLGDVRAIGSGNIGATNVLRTGSKKLAAATLLCDALKGMLPALAGMMWGGEAAGLAAAYGAFLGHLFPVWLGFKGGKGVATYIGILFGLWWPLGLIFLAIWLAMAFAIRISSASALTASVVVPLIAFSTGHRTLAAGIAILTLGIYIAHRTNIARLLKGEEPRIELQKKA
ncbi:MAG: glycerol-3-phosphate 1-O-acyltransferase PlsY [Parvibaculaceae bacterium]